MSMVFCHMGTTKCSFQWQQLWWYPILQPLSGCFNQDPLLVFLRQDPPGYLSYVSMVQYPLKAPVDAVSDVSSRGRLNMANCWLSPCNDLTHCHNHLNHCRVASLIFLSYPILINVIADRLGIFQKTPTYQHIWHSCQHRYIMYRLPKYAPNIPNLRIRARSWITWPWRFKVCAQRCQLVADFNDQPIKGFQWGVTPIGVYVINGGIRKMMVYNGKWPHFTGWWLGYFPILGSVHWDDG